MACGKMEDQDLHIGEANGVTRMHARSLWSDTSDVRYTHFAKEET